MRFCALALLTFSANCLLVHNSWKTEGTNLASQSSEEKTAIEEVGHGFVQSAIRTSEKSQTEKGAFSIAPAPYLVLGPNSEAYPGTSINDVVLQRLSSAKFGSTGDMCEMPEALAADMETQIQKDTKSESEEVEDRPANCSTEGSEDGRCAAGRLGNIPSNRSMGSKYSTVAAQCQKGRAQSGKWKGYAVATTTDPPATSTAPSRSSTRSNDGRGATDIGSPKRLAENHGTSDFDARKVGKSGKEASKFDSCVDLVPFTPEPIEEGQGASECSSQEDQDLGFRVESFPWKNLDQGATSQPFVSAVQSRTDEGLPGKVRRNGFAEGGSQRSFQVTAGTRNCGGDRRHRGGRGLRIHPEGLDGRMCLHSGRRCHGARADPSDDDELQTDPKADPKGKPSFRASPSPMRVANQHLKP